VKLLFDLGADLEAKDNDGDTVLHGTVRREIEVVVRLLVDKGADVKAKDKH
jgi:ankyrin repeat protein